MCWQCLNTRYSQARTYFRVWDNRLEFNMPFAPACCCTRYLSALICCESGEDCVYDCISVKYFDRPPIYGGCTCCICLGPPVIYAYVPTCCYCVDLRTCLGEQIKYAPCNCYGLRTGIWYGRPCYTCCACPIVSGAKETGSFLFAWKGAVEDYAKLHDLDSKHIAVFDNVVDTQLLPADSD